jgi:K+-sensing histidine kinase KdpD
MNEVETLKEELKQTQLAYQMAIQWSQFKAGFLARISHELRSPLSSLIGLHQLILSDLCESPEEQREFLSQAHQSALKLMRLIDEVVDIAKTSYGTKQMNLEPIRLAEIFNDVQSLTHLQAANRNIRLQILKPDDSVFVMVDRARLIQLLAILIDGAIDSMKDGTITLLAEPSGELPLIEIGIDLDSPPQIWNDPTDLLQSFDAKSKNPQPNSSPLDFSPGMKLMLAQTLIETMNGNLTVIDLANSARQDDAAKNSNNSVREANQPLTRLQCSIPRSPVEINS